jgi:hypothetical protein
MSFKILFYKVLSLILWIYFKTLILGLLYASKTLFDKFIKILLRVLFILKNMFLTVLKCPFEF